MGRYCINSAALRFIPVEKLVVEGYAEYLSLFQAKQLQEPPQWRQHEVRPAQILA